MDRDAMAILQFNDGLFFKQPSQWVSVSSIVMVCEWKLYLVRYNSECTKIEYIF